MTKAEEWLLNGDLLAANEDEATIKDDPKAGVKSFDVLVEEQIMYNKQRFEKL